MEKELEEAWEQARSIESKPEELQAEKIGECESGRRIYVFYRDNAGAYWFENKIKTEKGNVPEYEAIFGRKGKRR